MEVYLKREDLQDVRSYKIRGAYYNIASLSDEEKAAGVVAASAGNHAQGVAYACRVMGIRGKIFVPKPTPKQKRDRILVHGGDAIELVVVGNNFDEAARPRARTPPSAAPPSSSLSTPAPPSPVRAPSPPRS